MSTLSKSTCDTFETILIKKKIPTIFMEFDKHNLKWRCKSKGQGQGLARYQESLHRNLGIKSAWDWHRERE